MLLLFADAGNGSSQWTVCGSISRLSGVFDRMFIRSRQRVSTAARSLQQTHCSEIVMFYDQITPFRVNFYRLPIDLIFFIITV